MFGYEKRPSPPTWKILLYCVLALLLITGLGWFNTNVLGDKTHYDSLQDPPSSAAVSAAGERG